jgi:hypothetical protein
MESVHVPLGVFARARVCGRWFWWIFWSSLPDQRDPPESWQPEEELLRLASHGFSEFLVFEHVYPRELLDVRLCDVTPFPFATYFRGHNPDARLHFNVDVTVGVRVGDRVRRPVGRVDRWTQTDSPHFSG